TGGVRFPSPLTSRSATCNLKSVGVAQYPSNEKHALVVVAPEHHHLVGDGVINSSVKERVPGKSFGSTLVGLSLVQAGVPPNPLAWDRTQTSLNAPPERKPPPKIIMRLLATS